jgi:hypothetical protein
VVVPYDPEITDPSRIAARLSRNPQYAVSALSALSVVARREGRRVVLRAARGEAPGALDLSLRARGPQGEAPWALACAGQALRLEGTPSACAPTEPVTWKGLALSDDATLRVTLTLPDGPLSLDLPVGSVADVGSQ